MAKKWYGPTGGRAFRLAEGVYVSPREARELAQAAKRLVPFVEAGLMSREAAQEELLGRLRLYRAARRWAKGQHSGR